MNENNNEYLANSIEKYWQNIWQKKKIFQTKNDKKIKKITTF